MNDVLNLGIYNITNGIPINIVSQGKEGKNKEVRAAMKFIKKNKHIFKNNIIVADRLYFNFPYKFFMNFLIENDLK